jgi:hypothetical protein
MYHTIEFTSGSRHDLEGSRKAPQGKQAVRQGARRQARLRPYVVETRSGPIEVADLHFDDGTALHGIPFACFFFVD